MRIFKTLLNYIILFKSFFKKKTNKIEINQSDEQDKPKIKRLVYTKRTDE
jgi:hypothetical protein